MVVPLERSLFRGKGYWANAERIKAEARRRSARHSRAEEDDPHYARSSAELLASASAPLITRDEIEQAVTESMAKDPREISRWNEVMFITVAGVVCILIFVRRSSFLAKYYFTVCNLQSRFDVAHQVATAMAMEHPRWAASLRSALMLPPPPGYVPPQQVRGRNVAPTAVKCSLLSAAKYKRHMRIRM